MITLATCPPLGPHAPQPQADLPPDAATNPLAYLPPAHTPTQAERTLATNYRDGDFSGGYITSQVAHFRCPKTPDQHQLRRDKLHCLRQQLEPHGYCLPPALIQLAETDAYIDRLRHSSTSLLLPDVTVPLPADPTHLLVLIAHEEEAGSWYLLLAPDTTHIVTYSDELMGLHHLYPPGHTQDLTQVDILQCADTFNHWIVHYFADCIANDHHHLHLLKTYPGQ